MSWEQPDIFLPICGVLHNANCFNWNMQGRLATWRRLLETAWKLCKEIARDSSVFASTINIGSALSLEAATRTKSRLSTITELFMAGTENDKDESTRLRAI
jgi:hypothetical protein